MLKCQGKHTPLLSYMLTTVLQRMLMEAADQSSSGLKRAADQLIV